MIRGAIFDLDGTLLDSNIYWDRAPAVYLASLGREAKPALAKDIFPMTLPEAAEYMAREYGLSQSAQEIADGVNAAMERFYREETPLKPGIPALLSALRVRGIPLMVASVTDKSLVETALRRHGVLELFEGVITTEEVGVGKQEPDVYLRAAERLGSIPAETLVFEDALHAIRTANRARFRTVGICDVDSADLQEEIKAACEFYLQDYSDCSAILAAIDA